MATRINKYLSEVGYCSRREADRLILEGKVTINGKIASEVIDDEKAKRLDKGFIGFQLHSGDKMVIAFKDISVKR